MSGELRAWWGAPQCPRRCNCVPAQAQLLQRVSRGFEALRRRPFVALLAKGPTLPARERRGDGAGRWRAHRGVLPWSLGLWWGRARTRCDEPGIPIDIDVHGRPAGVAEGDAGICAMTARFISKHPLQNLTRSTYRLCFEWYCVPLDGRAQGVLGKARRPLSVDNGPY